MLLRKMKNFLNNTSGQVGIMFGIMSLPVVVMMGGAVDMLRVSNSQAKLQAAVESGVLSAASLTNGMTPEEAVQDYIESNVGSDTSITNLQVTIDEEQNYLNKKLVRVTATADVPLTFLQMTGAESYPVEVVAEAVESRQVLEISMVLDISSSMGGNRLVNLKSAASVFVDQMLDPSQADLTSINLVPFGGVVNIGALYDQHVISTVDAEYDPDESDYSTGADVPNQEFRFTTGHNCVELRREDFDMDLVPEQSRAQVHYFWKYVNFNPWCPDDNAAAIWNSNDADALKNRINNFSLSDGTGMDHGIAWGAKALSPAYSGRLGGDFPDRPLAYSGDDGATKIMVLMTDGGITAQFRPEDIALQSVHTSGKNKRNEQRVYIGGGTSHTSTSDSATGRFKSVCDDLKAQGITIYTIGFQIRPNSKPEHLLEYCASNPANYFLVESLDIGAAFNSIAASINKLRVSG